MLLFIFVFYRDILKLKETKPFFFEAKRIITYIINKYTWIDKNNDNNKFYLTFLSLKLCFLKSFYLFILYNLINGEFKFCSFRVLKLVNNDCGVFYWLN